MAIKEVTDSQGKVFEIKLAKVDRSRKRVMFEVEELNARFIFTVSPSPAIIQSSDRQAINSDLPATLHVSRSLYSQMAIWATSIIHANRR